MAPSKPLAMICPECGKPATANVKGKAVWSGRNLDGEPVNSPCEWALVQCSNCALPSVQLREDYGRGFGDDDPVVVYPAPPRLYRSVPVELRREWEEARICFEAKAYAACVVMVRRTLEGTAKDQGVLTRNLASSLKKLREKKLIDGMLAEWADALRFAGNQGAHFTGEEVSREMAEDALAFAEALLDHLYVLRQRFEEFKSRLEKSQKK
jgi:hypothetical protein